MTSRGNRPGARPSNHLVFPVGHGAGLFVPAERTAPAHHEVRVGHGRERLTEHEFGTWMLAHRPAEPWRLGEQAPPGSPLTKAPWSVDDLVAAGHGAGLPDAARRVDELLSRGLLVEVTDPVAFAHRYRLASLFLGLGNRPCEPGRFGIGVPGLEPLATVDSAAFELWQWGWVTPSLWAHCQVLATIGEQETDEATTPEDQVELVLGALRALLEGFVAFLEPVTTQPPAHPRSATSAAG